MMFVISRLRPAQLNLWGLFPLGGGHFRKFKTSQHSSVLGLFLFVGDVRKFKTAANIVESRGYVSSWRSSFSKFKTAANAVKSRALFALRGVDFLRSRLASAEFTLGVVVAVLSSQQASAL
jgi:hypothetical protein